MGKGRAIKSNKEKRTIVSNKKKDRDQFKKEMDMVLLKNRIGEIMKKISNEKTKVEDCNDKFKKSIEIMNQKYTDNILYQNLFQNYIKNEYTLACISFVNKIIVDIKHTHLGQYEGKYNLNKIFNDLAKELMMNEYELVLLSLYLEYINISLYIDIFSLENSLLYLCFFIKKLTLDNTDLEPILCHLNKKYENFEINYERWYKIIQKKFNEGMYFHHKEINKRFREYNKPFNEYCSDNYIDYNYIVDRILTMSLPYVDVKKENNINQQLDSINIKINDDEQKKNEENNLNENDLSSNGENNNNKIKINLEKSSNMIEQNIFKNEINFNNNNNNLLYKTSLNDPLSNMKYQLNNINALNNINNINNINNLNNLNNNLRISPPITANSLLHSLSNANKFRMNEINNKILVSNYNNFNENKPEMTNNNLTKNITMNNNLLLNQIQTPSQASLLNQQKPSLLDMNIYDKNSRLFDVEDEALRQILKNSNDNNYIRSSLSFDSPRFPFGMLMSNNNLGNIKNPNFINGSCNNDLNKKKTKNNDVPFKPLNIICNKSVVRNIINNQNIICNNCEITKPNIE